MVDLKIGDFVRLKDAGTVGKIVSINDGLAIVNFTTFISSVSLEDLVLDHRNTK